MDADQEFARPLLSIVVPVYRSAPCLPELARCVEDTLTPSGLNYELILVNDCSPDDSWGVIERLCTENPAIIGIDLRRNFGQDNAIMTGLRIARAPYIAIMDDDLQHHPRDLPLLLETARSGFDVVYADFRHKKHKMWKNAGSWFNGKVAEWVIDKPRNVYLSPYKVINKAVADLICQYTGPAPYVDGLLFQVTSRMTQVRVEHHERFSGTSNYTLWRSIRVWGRLALSFSVKPLRLVSLFGFFFALLGLGMAVVVSVYRLFWPEAFPPSAVGWSSLMVALLILGGMQMIFFGVLGEYAGRTFLNVNNKPQAAVREILNSDQPTALDSRRVTITKR